MRKEEGGYRGLEHDNRNNMAVQFRAIQGTSNMKGKAGIQLSCFCTMSSARGRGASGWEIVRKTMPWRFGVKARLSLW